jgi:uncharacterized protein YndB with AHSA1/START domain
MPVTDISHDSETLTLSLSAEFEAGPERVWRMWEDPRLLEKWWGPPTHPATFVDHDFTPGGRVSYFMTGPGGEKYHGWWRILSVDPPGRLEFEDGFADSEGHPDPGMPVTVARISIRESPDREGWTRMTMESRYGSLEDMEKVIEMGVEEGITAAVNQIDALLQA